MIAIENGHAMINNANLVKTDIDASNGVIHVIDSVLIPGADQKQSDSVSQAQPAVKTCPLQQQRVVIHAR